MFRTLAPHVLAFDCEWVPDAALGRVLYELPEALGEAESWQEMWRQGGATEDEPRPYLKTVLCRVASIAGVLRSVEDGQPTLRLFSLPKDPSPAEPPDEVEIIRPFLTAVGKRCPQLVGFNSHDADLRILVQRGVALGIPAPEFCHRPDKPWEGIDYFARSSEWNLDLKDVLGGWGRSSPSLHEMATAAGIPGKLELQGTDVADLWLARDFRRIVAYNELDAFTTYLLWLRVAHFAGFFSSDQYAREQARFRALLEQERESRDAPHVAAYLDAWDRLRHALGR
jgi:3'-5' exonuclease